MLRIPVVIALVLLSVLLGVVSLLFIHIPSISSHRDALSEEKLAFIMAKKNHKIEHPKRYDKPKEAQVFHALKRAPTGHSAIPVQRYASATHHMRQMRRYSSARRKTLPSRMDIVATEMPFTGEWESLGPGNVGGRTRAIVINPVNPSVMYAAGVAGGVWKTTNGGASWAPLNDLMANLAVNSMAMDPQDANVIYAGTGEGYFNIDVVRGDGIFKTTDGGTSWTQLVNTAANADFYYVNDVVVSSNDSRIVYAATRTGVFRSGDGGTSWLPVMPTTVTGGCLDVAIRSDKDPDHLFVSCGTFITATIFRSADGGDSWEAVLTEPSMGRTALAIAPSNQEIIYALAASIDGGTEFRDGLHAVFRSTSGGAAGSWTARVRNVDEIKLNTVLLTNTRIAYIPECSSDPAVFINQGWYDNVIAVDPVDPEIVWVGGIDLFRSDDGGANWGEASYWWDNQVPQYAHADHHVIVSHPNYNGESNKRMYVGTDGGVFLTDDARAQTALGTTAPCDPLNSRVQWTDLNSGFGVTQFYHGLPYPDGATYFGGTQDNGTVRGTDATGANAWNEINGGDGGFVAVDPTNTNIIFAENPFLSIKKSIDGGLSFSSAIAGINPPFGSIDLNFLFITPFVMDPSNPQILWTGGFYMWRTKNQAEFWEQASAIIPGTGSVSAIAVFPANSDLVMAGMSDGIILTSENALSADGSVSWTSVTPTQGFVSSLAFDPRDKQIAYATYSTFGVDHVWKTTDTGLTWAPIDHRGQLNGIPDIPANSIVVDPVDARRLFVGTDLGVFVTADGGQTWMVENTGFANVVTEKLAIINADEGHMMFAFTHGRGAFRVQLNHPSTAISPDSDGDDTSDSNGDESDNSDSSDVGGDDESGGGGGGGCALGGAKPFDPLLPVLVLLAGCYLLPRSCK